MFDCGAVGLCLSTEVVAAVAEVEKEKWGSYNVGGEDAIAPCSNPQGSRSLTPFLLLESGNSR